MIELPYKIMIQMTGVGNSPTVFSNFEPVVKSSNSPGGWRGRIQVWPAHNRYVRPAPCTTGGMKPERNPESYFLFQGCSLLMHMSNWLVFYHNVSFEDMSCDFFSCFISVDVMFFGKMGRYSIQQGDFAANEAISQSVNKSKPSNQ